MPTGVAAIEAAAHDQLLDALAAARTVATQLVLVAVSERDRGLGVTLLKEIARAERAVAKIGTTGPLI